jgi:hypothetical protein
MPFTCSFLNPPCWTLKSPWTLTARGIHKEDPAEGKAACLLAVLSWTSQCHQKMPGYLLGTESHGADPR